MDIKIKLKIKDVEIELDRKELKELQSILNELFPKEKEYIYYPYRPLEVTWYPWYPNAPSITYYPYNTTSWTTSSSTDGNYTIAYNSNSTT